MKQKWLHAVSKNLFFCVTAALMLFSLMMFSGGMSEAAVQVSGSITPIENPTSSYTSSTTKINISGISNGSNRNSITDGTQTVTFSSSMEKRTAPSIHWLLWPSPPISETNNPPILIKRLTNTITWTLSKPASIFGFELQKANPLELTYSVEFYTGDTLVGTIKRDLPDNAPLFAAETQTTPFTKVVIKIGYNGPSLGFAVAQIRYKEAPPVDLAVTKSGPAYSLAGDPVTFNYAVTNNGPGSAAPSLTDDKCGTPSPVLVGGFNTGDSDQDNLVDPGETWQYSCAYTPTWVINTPVTNTVTVSPADALIVDSNANNNTDSCTIYPWTLRKDVLLQADPSVQYDDPNTEFSVELQKKINGSYVTQGTITLSEDTSASLWLSEGDYNFLEVNLPSGYEAVDSDGAEVKATDNPDYTLLNVIDYDLAVEKSGPAYGIEGDPVTFNYAVTNAGPGGVAPALTDDLCGTPTYNSGDSNSNGLVDVDETWQYTCTYTPTWEFNKPVTNTATVSPANNLLVEANLANNTDSYTIYPWLLRKDVLLYQQGATKVPYDDPDTEFTVEVQKKISGSYAKQGECTISEASPAKLWLSEGDYKFLEQDLPDGYLAAYQSGVKVKAATDYPDYTMINAITFDLAVEKTGPELVSPCGQATYEYTVTNAGPAAVTPVLSDDKSGTPTYISGDINNNGKIEADETWQYTADYNFTIVDAMDFTNTVTVSDAEGAVINPDQWKLGGDRDLTNNTDDWTVCLGAWGYDNNKALPFKTFGIKDCGWTNGGLKDARNQQLTLYAGIGNNNIGDSIPVGTVTVSYNRDSLKYKFNINPVYKSQNLCLYIGKKPLPLTKSGKSTIDPEEFTFRGIKNGVEYTVRESTFTGEFFLIPYAEVCLDQPD
ncbi:MAG: hypothetical protein A4E53_03553 [Pelotomaculum sp. PtaB.Bin104]|nr:MAG: hypothetical protein A4E53_03553 [Pelotomaculum sp. PtaB.Bin104]